MRSLAECGPEQAMEVEFGKTGLPRRLLQQNARLIFGSEQVPSPAEPAEGIVMEQ